MKSEVISERFHKRLLGYTIGWMSRNDEDWFGDENGAPPDLDDLNPDTFFRKAVIFELGLGGLGLFLAWMTRHDARELVPSLQEATAIGTGILWGVLAAFPLLLGVLIIDRLDWPAIREVSRITNDRLIAPMKDLTWLELSTISLCAGVGEEILFRGWLQGWLMGPLDQASASQMLVAVGVAALAFGAVHALTPLYFFLATLAGVYFGVLLILSGNLIVPIVAHAVYDAVQLIQMTRATLRQSQE